MKMLTMLTRASMVLATALVLAEPAAADDVHYGKADLDQMLAPIALYPDSVLSHVLIAATYPLEVAQAARWSRAHSDLQGEDAVDAVDDRDWDASVKALVAFPEILARMDDDLEWTERLGEAFLDQEGEVMDRVQFLRARAYDEGHLDTEHTRVIREREVIYIEPAVTEVVYVPYYDPWFVYGSWWWADYPPYCWHRWDGRPVSYYRPGFYWGIGFRVAPTFYFTSFQWSQRQVVVNDHRRPMYSGRDAARGGDVSPWRHTADRVRGMHYRSESSGRPAPGRWSGAQPETGGSQAPGTRRERRREPMDERVDRSQWREERRELHREPPEPRRWQQVERSSRRDEPESRGPQRDRAESRDSGQNRGEGRGAARDDTRGQDARGQDARGRPEDKRGSRQRRQNNR